jgi:hypothetical protein
VAIALAVLPLAVQSMRNVHIFLLAALPALTMLVHAGSQASNNRKAVRENERVNGAILAALGAIATIAVGLVWIRPPAMLRWHPISQAAAQAIRNCGAPLYNTYGVGGELIWFVPQQPVFIDNRQDPYPTDVLADNRRLERDGQFRRLFDRYGIQCAAVPPTSMVARTLGADRRWSRRYTDEQWAVFTKSD